MSSAYLNLLRQNAVTRGTTGSVARMPIAINASRRQQVRFQSTSSAKGPSGAEASPQGSDHRGKATSYALPVVAVSLVALALIVRLSSKDSKQSAVNVGIGTEGASKLKGSKAKAAADIKASETVDANIK